MAKSTPAANEPVVIEPEVLVFLNIETVLLFTLVIIKSGLPSPSISPVAIQYAPVPVAKSILESNEPAVTDPEVLVFLKTETKFEEEELVISVTIISGLPSPSISLMAV